MAAAPESPAILVIPDLIMTSLDTPGGGAGVNVTLGTGVLVHWGQAGLRCLSYVSTIPFIIIIMITIIYMINVTCLLQLQTLNTPSAQDIQSDTILLILQSKHLH